MSSPIARKATVLASDIYYREAYADIQAIWGPNGMADVRAHAAILIRPDGVAARIARQSLACLEAAGFRPICVAFASLSRHSLREFWRYDLAAFPLERVELAEFVMAGRESIFVLLEDTIASGSVDASRRLKAVKGPADEARRKVQHLRSVIGARSGLFSYVHSPDDMYSFIHEFGVLFDKRTRRGVLAAKADQFALAFDGVVDDLYSRTQSCLFDFAAITESIGRSFRSPAKARFQALLAEGAKTQSAYVEMKEILGEAGCDMSSWPALLILSHVAPYELDGLRSPYKEPHPCL
jgi:hypothetical protein